MLFRSSLFTYPTTGYFDAFFYALMYTAGGPESVSYTHLDVYKRQAQHRHGFPRRVAAVFLNEIAQRVRHAHDVLHELVLSLIHI